MAVTYNFSIPISNRGSLPAWMFEQYNPDNPSQPLARPLEGQLTIREDGSIQNIGIADVTYDVTGALGVPDIDNNILFRDNSGQQAQLPVREFFELTRIPGLLPAAVAPVQNEPPPPDDNSALPPELQRAIEQELEENRARQQELERQQQQESDSSNPNIRQASISDNLVPLGAVLVPKEASEESSESSGGGCGINPEWYADCESDTIYITDVEGRGPIYRVYRHDSTSPMEEFVWHDDDPHATHSNPFAVRVSSAAVYNGGTKYLYALIESCGCCEELLYKCPDDGTTTTTTTTTTTSTTPGPTPPPTTSTTEPPTSTTSTTPCCPPKGEWYWNKNSPPSTDSGTDSGVTGPIGSAGASGSAGVTVDPEAGVVSLGAGTYDLDIVDYNPNSEPVRYAVVAGGRITPYYPGTDVDSVIVDTDAPWSIIAQRLTVNTNNEVDTPPEINVGSTSNVNLFSIFTERSTTELTNLVSGLTPGNNTQNIFTNYDREFNRNNPGLVRNTEFWGNDIKGITGISPFLNSDTQPGRKKIFHGVAITPRHVLIAEHVRFPPSGSKIGFIDRDNNVVERTILGSIDAPGPGTGDFNISVLNEDLPSNIEVLRALPSDILSQIPNDDLNYWPSSDRVSTTYSYDIDSLIFGTDQEEKGIIFRGTQLLLNETSNASGFRFSNNLNNKINENWNEGLVVNDSSSPLFFVVNNEAILITVVTTTVGGSLVGGSSIDILNNMIDSVDNTVLGFSSGYTINTINVQETLFPPPPVETTSTTPIPTTTTLAPPTPPPSPPTTPKVVTTRTGTTAFPPAPPATTRMPTMVNFPTTTTLPPTTPEPVDPRNPFTGSRPVIPVITTTTTPAPDPNAVTTQFPLAPPVTTTTQLPDIPVVVATTPPPPIPEPTTQAPVITTTTTPAPTIVKTSVTNTADASNVATDPKTNVTGDNPYPSKKVFQPHYMYSSSNVAFWAATYEQHEEYRKLGYTHDPQGTKIQTNYQTPHTLVGFDTTTPSPLVNRNSGSNTPGYGTSPPSYYSSYNELNQNVPGVWNNPINQISNARVNLQRTNDNEWLLQMGVGNQGVAGVQGEAGKPGATMQIVKVNNNNQPRDIQRVNFELPNDVDFLPLFTSTAEPITIERNANGEIISIDLSESFEGVTAEIIERGGQRGVRLSSNNSDPIEIPIGVFEGGIEFDNPLDPLPAVPGGNVSPPEVDDQGAAGVMVPREKPPLPGFPNNLDQTNPDVAANYKQYLEEMEAANGDPDLEQKALDDYYKRAAAIVEEQRETDDDNNVEGANENIFKDLGLLDENSVLGDIQGLVVSYKGKCYRIKDATAVLNRSQSSQGDMDSLCNPPVQDDGSITPGWEECPCCPPDKTTPPPTSTTSTTPPPPPPGVTTSTTTSTTTPPPPPPGVTTSTTPPPTSTTTTSTTTTTTSTTTTTTTTPCCVPECSPPAERLGMWFYDDDVVNYLRPYNYVAEEGAVFWEGPEFEGNQLEKRAAYAALEGKRVEFNEYMRMFAPEQRGPLLARITQWQMEYMDEDKRRCYAIHDADWVNQNKETRPSKDVSINGIVPEDDLNGDGTPDRGKGWVECECCPCCPPTNCDICWFWNSRRNNILAFFGMAVVDPAAPEGINFNVDDDLVVKYCCEDPPFVLDGFVDEVIQEAFDKGKDASDEFQNAQLAISDELENTPGADTLNDLPELVRNALQERLAIAEVNLNAAAIDFDVAKGNPAAVRERLLKREELGGNILNEQERNRAAGLLERAQQIIEQGDDVADRDALKPGNEIFEGLWELELIDDDDDSFTIDAISEALERKELIENDDNWTGPAEGNQVTPDDIVDGDDLDANAKFALDNVAKNYNEDCEDACRPVCFKVIDAEYVNANPMLNPAVDVLSHVNDLAINPQNKDKDKKFFVKDLEPTDKGKGWEMCECCPCPGPIPGPVPQRPPGPVPEVEEPEVIIVGDSFDFPPVLPPPPPPPPPPTTPRVTTPRVTTTTERLTTNIPTTICPPDSKGGPRCNVLKW